jgi:hypothetical protein
MTRTTRRIVFATVTVLLIAAAAVAVGLWAKGVENAAIAGKGYAEAGVQSLTSRDATAALHQFGAASKSFAAARTGLGPEWFVGIASAIPWVGRQYSAVDSLVRIGIDGADAGAGLAGLLHDVSVSASASATGTAGSFGGFLVRGHSRIIAAVASMSDAADRAASLPTEGLVPQLAREVRSVQSALQRFAPLLKRGRELMRVLSFVASGRHRILIVSQDGAELRPTGGFAGSFDILDVGPDGFSLESYQDVYVLPMPSPPVPAPPGALMHAQFSFRDANWWIDFPTSARAMLGFWRIQGQAPVDGIIAIDTVAIEDLLAATGPVSVPGYAGTFTSQNLLTRLLDIVEIKSGGSADRKTVLGALASRLEDLLRGAGPAELEQAAQALSKAADAKHIQMYFPNSSVEAVVDSFGWSGRVAPPAGTTDVLAISNGMNQGAKANAGVKKTIQYAVELRADRSADTTLVLSFANTEPYPKQLPPMFRDWLRVYRRPGTVFPSVGSGGGAIANTVEFGFPAQVRTFKIGRGQSRIETLAAHVPDALVDRSPTPKTSSRAAYYRLYVVRQDDLTDIATAVTLKAPPGWSITGASAHLTASGAAVPVTIGRDGVRMDVPLSGDLVLDVSMVSSQ